MSDIENCSDEKLWVEKYRPLKIEDCVLSPEIKKIFAKIVVSGDMGHLLLAGTQGTGKTTVAKALCRSLGADFLFINASEDNGIDILRTRIRQFASTMTIGGGLKIVILDEADYLSIAAQPALRGFMEEFSKSCRFIFTCNYKNRIISPLHSRCTVIEFNTTKKELAGLAGSFMKRLKRILQNESVEFDDKLLSEIIIKHAPDWRRILNECQRYNIDGKLDIVALAADQDVKALVKFLSNKDFKGMRTWVASNTTLDGIGIYRQLYDCLNNHCDSSQIPQAIIIIADYMNKAPFTVDREINLVACLTELMGSITFKS